MSSAKVHRSIIIIIKVLAESCNKPTSEKTLEDLLQVLRAACEFSSFSQYYSKMTEQEVVIYLLSISLETYKKFDVLCRIGDSPSNVYYLYEGSVAVTNLSNQVFTEALMADKVFHIETKGATLGEASILYGSMR